MKILKSGLKLKGGFTREVNFTEIDGNVAVIKTYQGSFKPWFVDFSKSTFSLFLATPRISFLSLKERVQREVDGHKKLKELGISVPKILDFSIKGGFVVEEFIDGTNLYELIKDSERKRKKISYEVGKMTGYVHSKGFAFVDNKPQNYIFKNGKIFRTDLETFEVAPSQFEKDCDVVSFVESFVGRTREEVHEAFIDGYECHSEHIHNKLAETLARRALFLLNFNLPRGRVGPFLHKNPVSSYSNPFAPLKHFFTRHFRKSKGD